MNPEAIRKFAGNTSAHVLPGGQNESVRAGNLVLKPVHESEKYLWVAESLNEIDFEELRVAMPVRSREGNYIENSIGATKYYEATFSRDKIETKLSTCRKLNNVISNIPKPDAFDSWQNPWTKAQDLAWSHSKSQNLQIPQEIKSLLNLREQIETPNQLVHVDLAGNILFAANDNPIIIDFTPGFYPKEYAEVLLLIDSIAWYDASIDCLDFLTLTGKLRRQLILRALIFRLSVPLFAAASDSMKSYQTNFSAYKRIIGSL